VFGCALDSLEPKLRALCAELLDPEESARAQRLVFERDRGRFVAAHGFLRSVLAEVLACDPRDLRFDFGPQGKPRLRGSTLHFSLTHTADQALLALAPFELGLDAEELRAERIDAPLARRVMTAEEFDTWSRASREEQVAAFFRLWCAKESVMKATGLGMSLGPRSFAVFSSGALSLRPTLSAVEREWTLSEIVPPPGCAAVLACASAAAIERSTWPRA
jgi:4'-phosphopantetheinyl transferase